MNGGINHEDNFNCDNNNIQCFEREAWINKILVKSKFENLCSSFTLF